MVYYIAKHNVHLLQGIAVGFLLDSLLKLTDTRATNNKITLMHYLYKENKHFVGVRLASGQDVSYKQLIIDPPYKIPNLDVPSDDSYSSFPRSVVRGICIFSKSMRQGSSNVRVVLPSKYRDDR